MTAPQRHPAPDTKAIAERLLSATFGGPVRLAEGTALQERTHVARFAVREAPAGAPTSVIVKRAPAQEGQPYDPQAAAFPAPAWRLFNDWAGLHFLGQVAADRALAPHFYAGDRHHGVVILEDLGAGESPAQVLLGADPLAAEAVLVELATALGHLHARTLGQQAVFDHIRDVLGPRADTDYDRYRWLATGLHTTAAALNLPLHTGVDDELERVIAALTDPGPFLAYTHGDPCPDNWLRGEAGLRLFDFEGGAFRHALTDGVYGRIHFPTCWCVNRLPEPLVRRMETAYRAALVPSCPAATDERRYSRALVEACAFWALTMCSWYDIPALLENDRAWGIATLRQRVLLRADILTRTTQEFGHLEVLGATLSSRRSSAPCS